MAEEKDTEIIDVTASPVVEPDPHEAIRLAEQMLTTGPSPAQLMMPSHMESNIQAYSGYEAPTIDSPPPDVNPLSVFEKFPEVSKSLRDETVETVDLFRVRKLNLAAAVETLERAVNAHESFPSADAGIAVAKLSEQVSQLTKELEKSQDPYKLYDKVVEQAMQPLTIDIIKTMAEEARWLITQFETHIPEERRQAFRDTVKQMVSRTGPALTDSLDNAKQRLLTYLNIKERK